MIKLLSISGSPTIDASTDIILNRLACEIQKSAPDKTIQTDFIKLNNITITPCQACGEDPSPDFCIYHELDVVYELIAECDLLLFGSPVFFDTVSAQSKLLIDRCNCFRPPDYNNSQTKYNFVKRLTRKRPGAIILVGGENGYFEGARRVIAGFFKWIEIVNEGVIMHQSPDYNKKGTAADDAQVKNEILQLAEKLTAKL